MQTTWLKTNRRALLLSLIFPLIGIAFGLGLLLSVSESGGWSLIARIAGWMSIALSALVSGVIVWQLRLPRLAYENGFLVVYLGTVDPSRIPIDLVEVFFRGQASSNLPVSDEDISTCSTVVVRIAESAEQWHHRDVKPSLGLWCDGYIIIRGTWCEPLTVDVYRRLNSNLVEAHRAQRELETASAEDAE